MNMNFGSIKRMTIGAIFLALVVYFGWATATFYIIRAIEKFLLTEIPALDQFDPHLVRVFVALASLILIVVLRQVLFPFLPQISEWLSFGRSGSGFSRFRLGFFGLWAFTLAVGAGIQFWAERPDADHIFSSTGPRANICKHPDGRLTLQSLDTHFDYTDGSPCVAATPATAAAFQAQRRQDEAAGEAAVASNSSGTATQPAANGKNPQVAPSKPSAKPTSSMLHNIAAWRPRNLSNKGEAESPTAVAVLPPANTGPYHIRLRNMTGEWLRVRAYGPNNVREFNLPPDADYTDMPARADGSTLKYTAKTSGDGAAVIWKQTVDLSRVDDIFQIDFVPPEGSSSSGKGLPKTNALSGSQN